MPGATPEYTPLFHQRARLPVHASRRLGRTDLFVSRLGFGSYRVDAVTAAHAEALQCALRRGINLIDTSTNYGDGESEELVGRLLQESIVAGEIRREETVVVSKIGYVQGQNLRLAREREAAGEPFPEMVKYMDGCWHCLHPEFLRDQLARSLSRLRRDRLEVLLLHNPEYFLSHAKKQGMELPEARAEYYRRITNAFRFLEEQASAGRLEWYGISSNTFPYSPSHPEFTSLEQVWKIAEKISPQHHFGVIQFPLNLIERGAVFEKNQFEKRQTLLEFAQEHGLGTLVNRPLNAITGHEMIRLADFEVLSVLEAERKLPEKIAALAAFEKEFHLRLAPSLERGNRAQDLEVGFRWAEQLQEGMHLFRDWGHWDDVKQHLIEPQTERALHILRNSTENARMLTRWESGFRRALSDVISTLSAFYARGVADRSQQLSGDLDRAIPELRNSPSLSQKALRVLLNTEGIDAVLLGMRRRPYVEDGLQALLSPPLANIEPAYRPWKN
jgi:aryl-alcohol dehydrogenase-like predicted oxidoreductase